MGGPTKPQLDRDSKDRKKQREGKETEKSKDPEESSADDPRQKETEEDGSIGVDGASDHGLLGDMLEDFDNRDGGGVRHRSILMLSIICIVKRGLKISNL